MAAALVFLTLLVPAAADEREAGPAARRIAAPGAHAPAEPSAAGIAGWTLAVLGLVAGAALVARKALRGSALIAPAGGAIELLGRRPLGGRQDLYLVAIGKRVLLVGSTKDGLTTLGEFPREEAPDINQG